MHMCGCYWVLHRNKKNEDKRRQWAASDGMVGEL